ncbi:uncharacterized protein PAN0_001d0617 [Moesziomyces antarcticus]|uniref:GAR domain-containing protein n=1 Tax=Pseudozyma antarctica TaxID=84753 RepID=A0A5C3FGY5_PSEA2|nr:uncharacterized protein PAN0_001d0617 [Moesziomyces antarcticus]GAK62417.1 conserved hypothetical protein [Moesziomyces antarcticus]SPO42965.1 uncharacterized protein PSANT_00649 [Moesziomyces antarcticus]
MPAEDSIDDARMHSLRISSEDALAAPATRTSSDDVESHQSGHAARPMLRHDQLSSEDYVELTRISHKKDDIERHIADLQSWSAWNPFEDVASYSTEPQVLLASKSTLVRLSQELDLRQGKCDRLEQDIQRFNVDDMKRLRKVAKATSKRHLSGPDTDLLELALSTIYALDKLLRLLRDQRAEHELTELRLRWERALLASWQDVAAIRNDIQAFERKCRALKEALLESQDGHAMDAALLQSNGALNVNETPTQFKQDAAESAAHHPSGSGKRTEVPTPALRLAVESVKLESSRLVLRVRSFDAEKVRLAGRLLDLLIDHRQVPEKLLDEQEKLEDALMRPAAIEAEAATIATLLEEKTISRHLSGSSSTTDLSIHPHRSTSEALETPRRRTSHEAHSTKDEVSPRVASGSRALHSKRLNGAFSTPSPKATRGSGVNRYQADPRNKLVNRYQADPRNKLDTAIGRIVNRLPMPVSIRSARAANHNASSAAKDEKDISGRYWIGDPEPRLCFCRILPSRTVMVRVGGGWQELSEFLTQHYSHLSLRDGGMHSAMLSPSKGHSASSLAWLRSASGPAGSPAARSVLSMGSPRLNTSARKSISPRVSRVVTMPVDLTRHSASKDGGDKLERRTSNGALHHRRSDSGEEIGPSPDAAGSIPSSGSQSSIVIHPSSPST